MSWATAEDGEYLREPDGKTPVMILETCKHRQCPWCAPIRVAQLKQRLKDVVAQVWGARRQRLMVLTIDDQPGESLEDCSGRLLTAFKKLSRRKTWKEHVEGAIIGVETTRNEDRGSWHVHLHILYVGSYWEQSALLAAWRDCLGAGDKKGGARVEEAKAGLDEVVKYAVKGIECADALSDAELQELLGWLFRRRMLRTQGNLYGVKVDEEQRDEEPDEWVETKKEWVEQGVIGMHPITGELHTEAIWLFGDEEADEIGWSLVSKAMALRRRQAWGPPRGPPG